LNRFLKEGGPLLIVGLLLVLAAGCVDKAALRPTSPVAPLVGYADLKADPPAQSLDKSPIALGLLGECAPENCVTFMPLPGVVIEAPKPRVTGELTGEGRFWVTRKGKQLFHMRPDGTVTFTGDTPEEQLESARWAVRAWAESYGWSAKGVRP
jgi:hypothetical protein